GLAAREPRGPPRPPGSLVARRHQPRHEFDDPSRDGALAARLEDVSARLSFEPVDVSVLIERVCHFYRRKAAEKQISITPDLHVEEPDARADRVAVAVVMDNLLSNAIKYSPHGRVVRVFVRAEPGFLVGSVQDEGPGISEEDQAKLFRRGVRLSSVPTG